MVSGPIILVLHAGGNDIGFVRTVELIARIRLDLARFLALFSDVVLIWSEIVPRPAWSILGDARAIERIRRRVNHAVSRYVRSLGGFVVRHRELEGENAALMRRDGVHLTPVGLDIFNLGLQSGVEQALSAGGSQPGILR